MTTTAQQFIGRTFTYQGNEFPWMRGLTVRLVGVMKGAARPDHDPDTRCSYLTDDDAIVAGGGIEAGDRVEVQPWMPKEGRWSFATSNPRAGDLGVA